MTELLERGDKNKVPWRIIDDIYWHSPSKTFEACQCGHVPSCDRIQVLLPPGFRKRHGKGSRSPTSLEDKGAVIFGHSHIFPLRWGDHGDPSRRFLQRKRGNLEEEIETAAAAAPAAAAPHNGGDSEITNWLPHRRGTEAGKNSLTQSDVPARNTSFEEESINAYSRVRLQSFGQMLRGVCRRIDR